MIEILIERGNEGGRGIERGERGREGGGREGGSERKSVQILNSLHLVPRSERGRGRCAIIRKCRAWSTFRRQFETALFSGTAN